MRYVPIEYAEAGSYLARPLVNESGNILLNHGARLTDSLIAKIKELGYRSLYIRDELSDIDIEDVIKPEVKLQMFASFKELIGQSSLFNERGSSPRSRQLAEREVQQTLRGIVDDLFVQKDIVVNVMDIKKADDYTYGHSLNVMIYAVVLGVKANLNREQLYDLAAGALLHDVGKLFVPEEILKKKSRLTEEEYEVVKLHPAKGFEFLKEFSSLSATARIVSLQHQERVNGTGYPRGLKEPDIHLFSKITAIADVYDALTSDRYYRSALPAPEALAYMADGAGISFNAELTDIFVRMINPYPLGALVRLSNGMEGVVAQVQIRGFQKPIVKILVVSGKRVETPWHLDLSKLEQISIKEVIYQLSGQ